MSSLHAAVWGKDTYVSAHPESDVCDPNEADRRGYELVAIQPNGVLIYRKKSDAAAIVTIAFIVASIFISAIITLTEMNTIIAALPRFKELGL